MGTLLHSTALACLFAAALIPAHFRLQYVTSQLYVDIIYVVYAYVSSGCRIGVAVSSHDVCSSYVCAVCCVLC